MRVSRTVLREAEGVTPSAYSPIKDLALNFLITG
jgi:hypothetical protein